VRRVSIALGIPKDKVPAYIASRVDAIKSGNRIRMGSALSAKAAGNLGTAI